MLFFYNMFNLQNGLLVMLFFQDMVLGFYYIIKECCFIEEIKVKGEGCCFYFFEEVMIVYNEGQFDLYVLIKV